MKRSAFTLIELLVVIAIIAILAAILFPVFAAARASAQTTTCMSNLRNLSLAFRLYADNNNYKMPSAYYGWLNPDWAGAVATGGDVILENGSVYPYAKSKEIYLCPMDRGKSPKLVSPARPNYPLSYTMNYAMHAFQTERLKSPTKMLLLIHEGRDHIDDGCFYWQDHQDGRNLPANIHASGTNAGYADGHAKRLSYDQLMWEATNGWWYPGTQPD
jgi:prepilin-type N-terminal cleavage/methylation domain-containing protein/prepilin-type processing-associated H-X9-DG protein